MAYKALIPTQKTKERALLVGVELYGQQNLLSLSDSLSELSLLARTAGLEVVGETTQKMERPNPNTFIGPGKVEEVKALAEEFFADIILFDEELSPRHMRELEAVFGIETRILDRTALILDIFAQHANTREGSLQVELAQYEYRLPRLTRAWTHLARQTGGGGGRTGSAGGVGLRGPGEMQLEVDRREIHRRIDRLKNELEKVRTHRKLHRTRRNRSRIPLITLVGYTNAGKSTLLNRLSDADVYVADRLFATLDPTTRRVELPGGRLALFTDTVGFIQKLPAELVAAFRATLEEITEADLLLHVVDITHPNARAQALAVHQTLDEIGASHIPTMVVLNKVDQVIELEEIQSRLMHFSNAIAISALQGDGIENLLGAISERLYDTFTPVSVRLPYQQGALISMFHELGQVDRAEHIRGGVVLQGKLPGRLLARFQPFIGSKEYYSDESDVNLPGSSG